MLTAKNKKMGLTLLGIFGGIALLAAFFRAQESAKAQPSTKLQDQFMAQLKFLTSFKNAA